MRILFAHLYDASFGMGGAEKVVLDLADAFHKQGHHVSVAVNAGRLSEKLEERGISWARIYASKLQTLKTMGCLRDEVRRFQPDLIHSHHRYTTFLADLFLKSKVPVIHTEHVLRKDKRLLFRSGDRVTAVHETVADNLKSYFHVEAEKISTITNAVRRPEPGPKDLESVELQMDRRPGQLWGLFIGRLEEQKGHRYLIDAAALLTQQERSRFRIALAGDGSLESLLRKRVQDLGLEDVFVFLGHTEKVAAWLTLCDFVVLSSLWEGMPLSVLEAFSAAKPVLATDIPGTREVMAAGETGWMAPPRDAPAFAEALRKVLHESEKLPEIGRKALGRWEREYSFEKMIHRYRQVYEAVIWLRR